MSVVSLFLGALFAKDRAEAEWYMQIAGAGRGAVFNMGGAAVANYLSVLEAV